MEHIFVIFRTFMVIDFLCRNGFLVGLCVGSIIIYIYHQLMIWLLDCMPNWWLHCPAALDHKFCLLKSICFPITLKIYLFLANRDNKSVFGKFMFYRKSMTRMLGEQYNHLCSNFLVQTFWVHLHEWTNQVFPV